jgi:hypothetical protein
MQASLKDVPLKTGAWKVFERWIQENADYFLMKLR